MTQDKRDEIRSFFASRATSGQDSVRAMMVWNHHRESLTWPTFHGVDLKGVEPWTIAQFVGRLAEIIGEDNAVEFRLRFL